MAGHALEKAKGSSNLWFSACLGKDLLSEALEKVMAWNNKIGTVLWKKFCLCLGKGKHTQSDFGKNISVALEKAQAWHGPLVDCFGKDTDTIWERLVVLEKTSLWPWKRLRPQVWKSCWLCGMKQRHNLLKARLLE